MMKITCWMPWRTARHDRGVRSKLSVLENRFVRGYLRRQRRELRHHWGAEALEAGFGPLGIILVRRLAIGRVRRPVAP